MNPLLVSTGRRPRTGAVLTCAECGKEFYAQPCQVNRRKFCSMVCKVAAQEKKTDRICPSCGKAFQKPECDTDVYCSWRCYQDHKKPGTHCRTCGTELKKSGAVYCSHACRDEGRRSGVRKPCEFCGKDIYVQPHQANKRFCSRTCQNEGKKLQGPGCKYLRTDGYIAVYYPSHPNATKSGMILEHRLVAEQKYGRRILKTEHVHHLNGIKDDNRPENLEIISPSAHAPISNAQGKAKRKAMIVELEEYRRRFGSLEGGAA